MGKPFYLITLIQGSTILYGTQSVGPFELTLRSYGFFVNQRLPCPLLASLGNWKEGGARLPRDSERLEKRV